MGDDPYDFDIAIPGKNGKASGYSSTQRYRGDSDDDVGMGDSNGSDRSGSDDDEESPVKRKPMARSSGIAASIKQSAGASSNALDKAKSFLSKYSSKSTPVRSQKLEMSLDDDDFSLDSSGEEVQKPKAKASNAARDKTSDKSKRDNGSKRGSPPRSDASEASDDSDEDRSPVRPFTLPQPQAAAPQATTDDHRGDQGRFTVTAAQFFNSGPDDSQSRAPVQEDSDEDYRPATTVKATTSEGIASTTRKAQSVSEEDDDEVESIASESEYEASAVSVPTRAATVESKPAVLDTGRRVSAVSESGGYEEENFEDDSVTGSGLVVPKPSTDPIRTSRPREEESNFDYSLDFADDPVDSPRLPVDQHAAAPTEGQRGTPSRSSSASSTSERRRDSYVEGSDDEDDERFTLVNAGDDDDPGPIDPLPPAILKGELVKTATDEKPLQSTPSSAAPTDHARLETALPSLAVESHHSVNEPPPPPVVTDRLQQLPVSRGRIVIVREYERDRSAVEKRDAGTQCTGNHAAIQTDLVPPGMRVATDRLDTASESIAAPPPTPAAPSAPSYQSASALPAPPPFTTFGLYDPLKLPTDTSMSVYKQQLLVLQQQIHQKKMETERLFRERVSSRYTSLRSTDRFLQSHRPSNMPLWEALCRVDPSLDEAKAREIARLAGHEAA